MELSGMAIATHWEERHSATTGPKSERNRAPSGNHTVMGGSKFFACKAHYK